MQRLPGIHGLRAVAALGVVLVHVAFLPTFIQLPPVFDRIVPNLGLCVPLFFVISAFSLAYSHERDTGKPGWIWLYLIKRLFRIGPLFWAMTAVWLIAWPQEVGLPRLLADLTFTFNFVPGQHESIVWAGWSIGVEMPFYLAFPFILERVRTPRDGAILFAATGAVSLVSRLWFATNYGYMAFTSNVAVFAVGLLAYRCFMARKGDQNLWRYVGIVAVPWTLAWLLLRPQWTIPGQPDALFWSFGFGLLCAWQAARPSRLLSHPVMQWLGERSFSLHLLHPLVILLLLKCEAYVAIWQALQPVIGSWAYLPCAAITLAVLFPAAALTYAFIERPGQKLGAIVIGQRSPRGRPVTAGIATSVH